jgi:hypothetical protein
MAMPNGFSNTVQSFPAATGRRENCPAFPGQGHGGCFYGKSGTRNVSGK